MSIYSLDQLRIIGAQIEEPLVMPASARQWLLKTRRVSELADGRLEPDVDIDHLGLAGLAIASGTDASLLSEQYLAIKNGVPSVEFDVVKAIALNIYTDYPLDRK